MRPLAKWFARKFEFTFPVELFPNLMSRLRGTPGRLEEILRNRSREVLTRKPGGNWSAQEHAGHLLDLESLWMARVEDFLSASGQLTAADLSNRKTDDAKHNSHELNEILHSFRTARSKLVDRVSSLDSTSFGRSLVHPRLKQPMRLIDHLYFIAEHDDHHLARIWELIH